MISLSDLTIGELAAYIAEHLRSWGIETERPQKGRVSTLYSMNNN